LNVWSTLALPSKIESASVFEKSVLAIREAYTGCPGNRHFLNMMYYLLGLLVGDAGKNFSNQHPWARIELSLSRKHPENLALGNYVMKCISMLGIPCRRIADGPPRKRDDYGQYRWASYFSEVVYWLHTVCLGLLRDELTSYDPVKMDWLLGASEEARIWFLRGVADSDGAVNVRNRTVNIVSEPNTALFSALLNSLGLKTTTWVSKGVGVVSVTAKEAWGLGIFNPEVETHRGRMLRKLANARTYQSRWPEWLQSKFVQLIAKGADAITVRNTLLWEDDTYVCLKTIKYKAARVAGAAL
jgi:hypothetical protein